MNAMQEALKTAGVVPVIECGYCHIPAEKVTGKEIYPHRPDLYHLTFYKCSCGAYVGCHKGTETPMGSLADEATRKARNRAHAMFDQLWKDGHMTRSAAYGWMRHVTGKKKEHCHIGMFDVETCNKVVNAVKMRLGD